MMIESPGKGMEHARSFPRGPFFTSGPLDVAMHLQEKHLWIPSLSVDEAGVDFNANALAPGITPDFVVSSLVQLKTSAKP
jgi:hypothetical protein